MQTEIYKQLVKVMPLRHSVRTYLPKPISKELEEQIIKFIDELSVPFEHNTKLQLFKAETGKKIYNNGINPVNNIALISQTDLISISKTGFIGELVMLYAISLGLSTCWFGHYKLSEVGKYINDIATPNRIKESTMGYGYGKGVDVGERVICCMPFGYKDEQSKRFVDFVAGKNGANRKPTKKLLENIEILDSIPKNIMKVIELAKLAPSAANSQMWRFGFNDDFTTITVAKPIGYKHFKWEHPDVDIGMCAAHIWIALLNEGYKPKIDIRLDADRTFWSFNL